MTKAQMIKRIQAAESAAWLALNQYDNIFAPVTGNYDDEIRFDTEDSRHVNLLSKWSAIESLMAELGIMCDSESADYKTAFELSNDLFRRRQAARGIYYTD